MEHIKCGSQWKVIDTCVFDKIPVFSLQTSLEEGGHHHVVMAKDLQSVPSTVIQHSQLFSLSLSLYIYIYICVCVCVCVCVCIQGVTGGTDQTSGGCSLC